MLEKVNNIDLSNVNIDLTGYATESYVLEKVNNIPSVDLSDYATKTYVVDKVNEIEISGGNYDDTEIRNDVDEISSKLDKFILGPYAYLTNNEVSYGSFTVSDRLSLFTYNDLYEYTVGTPYLESGYYTPTLWTYLDETPYPSNNGNQTTFKENKDIKDFKYKINIKSSNYDENSYLIQKCKERIYFLQGNSITLDSYTQKNINLSSYILTNCASYSVENVDWVSMPNLNSILIYANANSTEDRTVDITITESNNTEHIFSITQPGNPDYDPNSGDNPGGDTPIEEQSMEYEVIFDISATNGTEVGSTLSNNDISIVFDKGTNSNTSKYYGNGTEIRCYQGNTLTISSTYTITKIEFNASVIKNGGMFESNIPTLGSLSDNTLIWEGSYNEIIFNTISTTGSSSGQFKLLGIKITYLQ